MQTVLRVFARCAPACGILLLALLVLPAANAQCASIGCVAAGIALLVWKSRHSHVPVAEPALAVQKPA